MSTTPNRNKGLQSRKPLAARSKKAKKLYKDKRIPLVKRLLEERPWCEACGKYAEKEGQLFYRVKPSTDCHEIQSRGVTGGIHSGEWLDEDNILCVCRKCHDRITNDPEEAEELGLLKFSGT